MTPGGVTHRLMQVDGRRVFTPEWNRSKRPIYDLSGNLLGFTLTAAAEAAGLAKGTLRRRLVDEGDRLVLRNGPPDGRKQLPIYDRAGRLLGDSVAKAARCARMSPTTLRRNLAIHEDRRVLMMPIRKLRKIDS
jgi:hypothetical protein